MDAGCVMGSVGPQKEVDQGGTGNLVKERVRVSLWFTFLQIPLVNVTDKASQESPTGRSNFMHKTERKIVLLIRHHFTRTLGIVQNANPFSKSNHRFFFQWSRSSTASLRDLSVSWYFMHPFSISSSLFFTDPGKIGLRLVIGSCSVFDWKLTLSFLFKKNNFRNSPKQDDTKMPFTTWMGEKIGHLGRNILKAFKS